MRVETVADNYIFSECSRWGAFQCPHRDSVILLLTTINDDRTVLLKDRLIQDLNGLCANCQKFRPSEFS